MDLLQLEHFLAVAKERSFRRAAERVHRTQPAVSRSVKMLEEEVGAPLFRRDTPELSLTEMGKALVAYGRRMVSLRDDALRNLGQLASAASAVLSVAACESTATYLLPDVLRPYLQRFPHIKVRIDRARVEEVPQQVMDRQVDLGFVKVKPSFHHLRSVLVYSDEMILVGSRQHPLASQRGTRIVDLASERFFVHHLLCPSTQQRISQLFDAHGARFDVWGELATFESIKDFVQRGVGIAILPRITVMRELDARTLAAITVDEFHIPRDTFMVFRDSEYPSRPAPDFMESVRGFAWPYSSAAENVKKVAALHEVRTS